MDIVAERNGGIRNWCKSNTYLLSFALLSPIPSFAVIILRFKSSQNMFKTGLGSFLFFVCSLYTNFYQNYN